MRIEFLTQTDPIYILPLFDEFFRNYYQECEITQISCCKTMGSRSRLQMIRELTGLYGVAGFVRLLGRVAVSRVVGAVPLGKGVSRYFSLPQLCRTYKVECRSIADPNSPEFLAEVARRRSDLIVSIACPYILKKQLLSIPHLGCINIHHAPLPKYKGMMPTFWQLFQGERTVGLTIHYMTEKLDAGDALLQDQLPVQDGEVLDHLIRRSKRHAAHCLAQVLRSIATGSVVTRALNLEKGSYYTFPTLAEIREFQRRGFRAI